MALYMKQENDRSELQERVAAEMREKAIRNSLAEAEKPQNELDFSNSKYLENTKETTGLAFVWLLLLVAALIALGYFIWFAKA